MISLAAIPVIINARFSFASDAYLAQSILT